VEHLNSQWKRHEKVVAARHPVPLEEIYSADVKHEAEALLAAESSKSWEDLSKRENYHKDRHNGIEANHKNYRRLCDQIGLVYSPLIKTRRAQLQAVLSIASLGTTIPRAWWKADTTPVLTVSEGRFAFSF